MKKLSIVLTAAFLVVPLFVRRATHLIAVSQTTKDDVIREYGVSPDKITVVYEAAAADRQARAMPMPLFSDPVVAHEFLHTLYDGLEGH